MTAKRLSFEDYIKIEMCNDCSYADNYSIWSEDYYCFLKMERGNFCICEEHTKSRWIRFKTFMKSWIYLLR